MCANGPPCDRCAPGSRFEPARPGPCAASSAASAGHRDGRDARPARPAYAVPSSTGFRAGRKDRAHAAAAARARRQAKVPRPRWRTMSPSSASRSSALRIVTRDTPKDCARSSSPGSGLGRRRIGPPPAARAARGRSGDSAAAAPWRPRSDGGSTGSALHRLPMRRGGRNVLSIRHSIAACDAPPKCPIDLSCEPVCYSSRVHAPSSAVAREQGAETMNRMLRVTSAAATVAVADHGCPCAGPARTAPTRRSRRSAETCAALASAQLEITDEAAFGRRRTRRGSSRSASSRSISVARLVPATATVPEYCRVEGTIPTGDAGDGFNQVRFAVNLPTQWNGRFVMIGDGGFDGAVSGSTARVPEGYATANSDMGHDGRAFSGGSFGFNNRPREIDYGWRATHVTTVVAKGIIDAYYDRRPRYSYWEGCSTGGRQAAVEAQRFPADFDGIVSGDPFMNAIEIAMEQVWSSAIFFRDVNKDGVGFDNNITQADVDALRDARRSRSATCSATTAFAIESSAIRSPAPRSSPNRTSTIWARARKLSARPDPGHQGRISRPARFERQAALVQGQAARERIQLGQPRRADPGERLLPRPGRLLDGVRQLPLVRARSRASRRRAATIRRSCRRPESTVGSISTSTVTPRTAAPINGSKGPWTPRDGGAFMRAILNGSETDLRPLLVKRKAKYLLYHGFADGLIGPEPTIDYYDDIVKRHVQGQLEGRARSASGYSSFPGWATAPAACAAPQWAGTSCRRSSSGSRRARRPNRSSVTQDGGTTRAGRKPADHLPVAQGTDLRRPARQRRRERPGELGGHELRVRAPAARPPSSSRRRSRPPRRRSPPLAAAGAARRRVERTPALEYLTTIDVGVLDALENAGPGERVPSNLMRVIPP